MTQPALFADHAPTRGPLPDWLKARLEAEGRIDAGTGATRQARASRCPRCRRPVIRGLDEDWCSLPVDADPWPLAPEGEALARLAGERTYQLDRYAGRFELSRRDQWRIAATPAGHRDADILAAHHCDNTNRWPTATTAFPPPPAADTAPQSPPF